MLHRAVVFHIQGELPFEARMLMEDFRLAVNCAIRVGLHARVTSRNALAKLAYKDFRIEHPNIYSQHLVSSFEVAGSILKNLRRRWGKGPIHRIPYVRRSMMKAENQAYKFDRENGVVDPYNSSRKCPICGRIQCSRTGAEFECECGWRADRHVNAGINLLQTAFPEGMAGGLRFSPGAFQHDVVMIIYDPAMGARSEPNGTGRSVGRS